MAVPYNEHPDKDLRLWEQMMREGERMGIDSVTLAQRAADFIQKQNNALGGCFANQYNKAPGPPPPYARSFGTVDEDVVRKNPIYQAALSAVADMWRVAYPDWVTLAELKAKKIEEHVFMFHRLDSNGAFEVMNVYVAANSGGMVKLYRLKEGWNG